MFDLRRARHLVRQAEQTTACAPAELVGPTDVQARYPSTALYSRTPAGRPEASAESSVSTMITTLELFHALNRQ